MDDINLYNQFLELHKPQLLSSAVPEHFWKVLYEKLITDKFDAGNTFSLNQIESNGLEVDEITPIFALHVSIEEVGLQASDPQHIYLIDHAWTFKGNQARLHLEQMPSLAKRMAAITGFDYLDLEDPERIPKILKALWKFTQSYSIQAEGASIEDRMPIWYIMDEVGSAVSHSDDPTFRLIPFIFLPSQTTYSLLFPIKDCEEGDRVTRDYIENVPKECKERNALLLPWRKYDFTSENYEQKEPSVDYFVSGHILETVPQGSLLSPEINRDEPLKVYSEYDVLTNNLTAAYFEIVDNENDADVIWSIKHFKNFEELNQNTPHKFINQFPYEYVLTIKDLLSIICRRTSDKHHDPETLITYPKWLPTTYNLKTELIEFASYFQNRQNRNLDNHWIIKPWNLARGLDMDITSNLWKIMRLQTTGPKLAQKYIENPVLFYRNELDAKVKFDIRYVILLKSVQPLEAFVYTKFFLRFANQEFSLDNFEEYEKHYTVMNYTEDGANLKHIKCDDFIKMWQEQYIEYDWNIIEDEICNMLNEMLVCATKRSPPLGIGNCPQSRALYAADIMLSWDDEEGKRKMQPKLLEVNWIPDCKRACDYYPDFFNDCFKLLFLDEFDSEQFRIITKK